MYRYQIEKVGKEAKKVKIQASKEALLKGNHSLSVFVFVCQGKSLLFVFSNNSTFKLDTQVSFGGPMIQVWSTT